MFLTLTKFTRETANERLDFGRHGRADVMISDVISLQLPG